MDYRLLGPVEVVSATGAPLPVAGAKLQGLVVLLALDPRSTVSSARLIDALYNDPPATVENAVQQLVSKLRRVLAEGGAPGRVVTRPPGYCLDEPRDAVDALRFERLVGDARAAAGAGDPSRAVLLVEEALGLWRGEAFAGVTLGGEAAGVRTRMAELRDAAIDDRVDWELQRGNHTAVVAELEAAVAATPLRERRWGQLMVALYRCGRQSDALRTYRQARRTLADELGVAPGPELRRLEAAVLSHDPALAPTNVPTRVLRSGSGACAARGRPASAGTPRSRSSRAWSSGPDWSRWSGQAAWARPASPSSSQSCWNNACRAASAGSS